MVEPSIADEIIAEQMGALRNLTDYYSVLHFVDLHPQHPEDYFEQMLDRSSFRPPKDKSRRYAEKDAGISLFLKARAFVSKAAKDDLKERRAIAEAREREYAEEHAQLVEDERDRFILRQRLHNDEVEERRNNYLNGDASEVMAFIEAVLRADDFSLEFADQPQPYASYVQAQSYDHESRGLSIRYRIPDAEEICTIGSFRDNKELMRVEPEDLPKQQAHKLRMKVLHAVLIRTAALVFYSDPYDLVHTLTINGFFDYYDDAYGTRRSVDVIRSSVDEEEFLKVNLGQADPEELFKRLFRTTSASGLYTKKSYEIRALV